MCGIFAVSGKDVSVEKFLNLAMLNRSRGKDSAGIGYLNDAGGIGYNKIAIDPADAFAGKLLTSIRYGLKNGLVMGHTRQGTVGVNTSKNAHPWLDKEQRFLFAHNGMIHNYAEFGTFDVDSQSLEEGIAKENFSKYQGSIGLVWIDRNGRLFFYRHSQTLSFGYMGNSLIASSDDDHLKAIGVTKIRDFKENKMYCVEKGKIVWAKTIPSPSNAVVPFYNQTRWDYTAGTYNRSWKKTSHLCDKNRHDECIMVYPSFYTEGFTECECECHVEVIKKENLNAEEAEVIG